MPIYDVSLSHARGQKFSPLAQKAVLHSVNDDPIRMEFEVEQNPAIVREATPQLRYMNGGRDRDPRLARR